MWLFHRVSTWHLKKENNQWPCLIPKNCKNWYPVSDSKGKKSIHCNKTEMACLNKKINCTVDKVDHVYSKGICSQVLIYSWSNLTGSWLTLYRYLTWHSIDTPLSPWSTVDRKSTNFWFILMSQLTVGQLATDCWSSVNRVSTKYRSGCWLSVNQHSTINVFSIHDPIKQSGE